MEFVGKRDKRLFWCGGEGEREIARMEVESVSERGENRKRI